MARGTRSSSALAFAGRVAEGSVRNFLDDACPQVAASIAFRVIFSFFPLAIVLAALSGIVLQTTGSQDEVVDAIVRNLPLSEEGRADMRSLLEGATGNLSGLGLLGLIPLVWAATGMMGAIRFGLNRAWDVSSPRPFLQGKALDVLFVVVAFAVFVLSLGLSVGTSVVERHAADLVEDVGLDASLVTWIFGRLAPFLLALFAVTAAYRLLPAADPRLADVLPPALGVALVFAILQSAFGLYLSYVNDFNAVYGSLAAVVAFLYFVYVSGVVFLLGAEVAAEIPRARRGPPEDRREKTDESSSAARQLWEAVRGLVVRDDARPADQRARDRSGGEDEAR